MFAEHFAKKAQIIVFLWGDQKSASNLVLGGPNPRGDQIRCYTGRALTQHLIPAK